MRGNYKTTGRFFLTWEVRVTAIYLIFGVLWILISDSLLFALIKDSQLQETLAKYKGWAFVAGTALLYFTLLRAESDRRRKVEEEIRELNLGLERRVKERTEELEAFSYSVSHDLRAPLRGIEGFSKILLEDYGPKLDAEALRLIGVIRHNTLKMAQLIEDMLAFSRVSRANVNRERVDMTELAREAWRDAVPAEKAGLCSVPELPPAAGDSAMLRQVWSNMFSNAVKFTSRTPAPRIDVGCRTEGGFNVYTVKDNGAGFDPAYADKLFGIFQRLHTEKEFPGTGVGLALANRVITKHGGWMKAEGVPGKGAAFHFALPVISGEAGDK